MRLPKSLNQYKQLAGALTRAPAMGAIGLAPEAVVAGGLPKTTRWNPRSAEDVGAVLGLHGNERWRPRRWRSRLATAVQSAEGVSGSPPDAVAPAVLAQDMGARELEVVDPLPAGG